MSETTSRSYGARREHVQTYCMDGVGHWSSLLFAVSVRPRKHPQVCNALWNSVTPTGNDTEIVDAERCPWQLRTLPDYLWDVTWPIFIPTLHAFSSSQGSQSENLSVSLSSGLIICVCLFVVCLIWFGLVFTCFLFVFTLYRK